MSDERDAPREPAPDRPGFPTAPTEADYRDLDRAVCALLEERYPGMRWRPATPPAGASEGDSKQST